MKIRVGITIGDPAGIGPVICQKALRKLSGLADFMAIGSTKGFCPGKMSRQTGQASLNFLDQALDLLADKKIDCLVTCPVSKEAISKTGIHFSGHTEYLAQKTRTHDYVMMLLNDKLKFVLLTRHIPLKDVPAALMAADLKKTALITDKYLKRFFNIKDPKMVVCGLNPHASDNGLIGREENRIIKPILKKLNRSIKIYGPLSADAGIAQMLDKKFDCAIAMYHDQALIPLKLISPESGVNITLGLPFVRASPLHGTAFDIADKPRLVDPASLISAIKLAIKCASNLKNA